MVSPDRKSTLLMVFGAVFLVSGAILVIFWPAIFFAVLKSMMTLSPTSTSFEVWEETPIPMYLECFMFNITNVEEILAGENVRLRVQEMGPYVFEESQAKVNLSWNDNNTITYFNQRYWQFVPERSNGSLSDMVTSINPVIATAAYVMRYARTVIKIPMDIFIRLYHDNMFLTAPVIQWLFDGIEDPIIDIAEHIPNFPIFIPYDKFGWFYDRNGSREFDGTFVMNTGAEDFSRLGQIEMWNHSNRTMYRDECGTVKGSAGELWAPELGQPDVTVFASDICTYLILSKNETVEVQGIEGVRYQANSSVFDNGYNYPHTACYCDETRDADCLPPGALNVSLCRYGAPAFLSLPHFYHTDPYYPSKIDGLNPSDDYNFRLALEMYTGIPLQVSAQLQINLLIRHIPGISINNQLPDPDTLVPMFWFRQEVLMTEEYAALARLALNVRAGMPYGLYALTAIGVVLLMSGIGVLVRRILQSPDTTPILTPSDSQEHLS